MSSPLVTPRSSFSLTFSADPDINTYSFPDDASSLFPEQHIEEADTPSPDDLGMSFSQAASDFLQRDQLEDSLAAYRQAADCYLQERESVVAAVNAAGCFRNMGAVARLLRNYEGAIQHLQRAEELYRNCQHTIATASTIRRTSCSEPKDELSLDLMILETMQARANFYSLHQNDDSAAIHCHEECLRVLLEPRESANKSDVVDMEGVLFTKLSDQRITEILIVSLDNLSELYKMTRRTVVDEEALTRIDQQDSFATFLDALQWLQQRHRNHQDDERLIKTLNKSFINLSTVYISIGNTDRAAEVLDDALDLGCDDMKEICAGIDQLALAHENIQQYDEALACYEKALLTRSRQLGDQHIDVAKSLINVGRVMELQGNSEGSLDLYKAAHTIYARQITSSEFACQDDDDAAAILLLIPSLLKQERFEEARSMLTKALAVAENEEGDSLDKSRIYYDLGQAYIGLKDYISATICLVEAAKEHGEVSEEQVLVLLQRVEVLQRAENSSASCSRSFDRTLSTTTSFTTGNDSKFVMIRSASNDVVSRPSSRNRELVSTSSKEVMETSPLNNVLQEKVPHDDNVSITDLSSFKKMHAISTDISVDLRIQNEHQDNDQCCLLTPSPEDDSHKSDISSILLESDDDFLANGDKYDKLLSAPLVSPVVDEECLASQELMSSDSNQLKSQGSLRARGRRRTSPRRSKDDKSLQDKSVRSRNSQRITKVLSGTLRRQRRQGFRQLSDDNHAIDAHVDAEPEEEDVTEEDSLLNDAPVDIVDVDGNLSDDGISDISMRFEDTATRETSQEWWWGVTAEGFGRWFPASYVTQAVQAADAFLSAKSIHSKSKSKQQVESALVMISDEESHLDATSHDQQDYLSNAGITSTKASRGALHSSSIPPPQPSNGGARNSRSPHHNSLFSTAAPQHFTGGNDVLSEIAACREILIQQQKEFGNEHAKVSTSLFTLAVLYSRDRDVDASIECATAALRIQQKNNDFMDVSRSLHFLADLNLHQKHYKKALAYYTQALHVERSHIGYVSDATAKTLNCIGTVKSMQNDFREAMKSHEEALRILKECQGDNLKHPLVTETLCQIGSVYYRERNSHGISTAHPDGYTTFIEGGMLEVIGRAHEERGAYKMAIAFFIEKLHFLDTKKKSRENLEDAASTLNGLGMLSTRAGYLVEAIDYYEKALSIQLQLGCDEVHLATARVLTGAVQFLMGNWRKSLKLLQDAVVVLQDELGEKHETVAATHYQIGVVQAALCEYDLAMDSLQEALEIQQDLLGDAHPATLRTRREIGNLYGIYEAELDTAFEQFYFVLEHQKRLYGERHPNIAETLHSIGCANAKKGDYAQALRFLEECYYMRVDFLGWDHPLQATTLHVIARIHLKRGRLKKAINICDVVLGIRKDSLTERHIDVARTLTTKGGCLVAQGNTDKGLECLSEALDIASESLGENHPAVGDIYSELGLLHLRKCQFDAARCSIQKALDIFKYCSLDDDYESIKEAKEKLERIQRDEMLCV